MKKIFIMSLLIALTAASSFAATDPAFSGTFEYATQYDFDDSLYAVNNGGGEAKIALNGVVDEWSSVDAELVASSDKTLGLNHFDITTDIFGVLGVEGPVGLSLSFGGLTHEASKYHEKAGYGEVGVTNETGTYIGFKVNLDYMEKVKLIVFVAPSTYFSSWWEGTVGNFDDSDDGLLGALPSDPVYAFEVQFLGLVEGLDANIWLSQDVSEGFHGLGLTAGYGSDTFDAGLAFKVAFNTGATSGVDTMGFGVAGKYKLAIFDVGLSFGASDFSNFGTSSALGLNLTWKAVPDVLDVFAAVSLPFDDISNKLGVETGLSLSLGATSYVLGYEYNVVDFKSPDNVFTKDDVGVALLGGDSVVDGLFFLVKAAF